MKPFFLITLTLCCFVVTAQQTQTYYDWKWKPSDVSTARFLSVIEPADSFWKKSDYYIRERRLQMSGFFKDSTCTVKHGLFKYYHANGQLSSAGSFVLNKKHGLWLNYHNNGVMSDSINFSNGRPVGTELKWFPNGVKSDSVVYNSNGMVFNMKWFDNGQLSDSGYIFNAKRIDQWQYFHRNGKLSATETYSVGRLLSRQYYNEAGEAETDTTNKDRLAVCEEDWLKYVSNNIDFPLDMQLINGDKAVVVVDFTIDEDGNVADASVYNSLHSSVDKMVLKVIKKSPHWIPAIDHNRKVKAYRRQPVTIFQEEF